MQTPIKDIKQLLAAIQSSKIALECPSDNKVSYLCTSKECTSYAAYCDDEQCELCTNAHQMCDSVKIKNIVKTFQKFHKHQKEFNTYLAIKQEKIIEEFKNRRKDYEEQLTMSLLSEEQKNIVQALYLGTKTQAFFGRSCFELKNCLQKLATRSQKKGEELLQSYERQAVSILSDLSKLEEHLLNRYIEACIETNQQQSQLQGDSLSVWSASVVNRGEEQSRDEADVSHGNIILPLQTPQVLKEKQRQETQIQKLQAKLEELSRQNEILKHENKTKFAVLTLENKQLQSRCLQLDKQLKAKTEEGQARQRQLQGQLTAKEQRISSLLAFKKSVYQQYCVFDSLIIDESDFSTFRFIADALNSPKSVQLIFRASEHDFSGNAFRNKCNGIENTLTLIKNENNEAIAVFTPLKWEKSLYYEVQYQVDNQGKSFMLLLRKQMKLELKDKTKANGKKCYAGPIFGEGDVYIADCCHNNKKSHFGFPKSYQFDDKQLKNKKVSSKLTGYFSILEYEVYTIISK